MDLLMGWISTFSKMRKFLFENAVFPRIWENPAPQEGTDTTTAQDAPTEGE